MTMLQKCMKAYNEFKSEYFEGNYYIPDDGGFNYLSRLNDFTNCLLENNLIKMDDHIDNLVELEFENKKDAKIFFETTCWLKGKDDHFTSCAVNIELIDNKVKFIGYEW